MRCSSVLLLALALAGCREEPSSDVTPLPPLENARPAPVAAEPSPAIVSPHLRRAPTSETSGSDLRRPPGQGAGGGEWWKPRPAPEPSPREVAAFSERLRREVASNVDSNDDPCEQAFDLMRAAAVASEEPGVRELPSRTELRQRCGELPDEMEECLSPDYFRAHTTECNRAIARLAERGERLMADAQEREQQEARRAKARR